jgi:ADP-heptose:LPS heptosyltransferase
MNTIVANVKKIAVLRANEVGDFIVALPALEALRNAYPNAEISLLAKPWHKEFLLHRRSPIDRVIVVPVSRGVRIEQYMTEDSQELKQFFIEMKKELFDIAIQLHGGGKNSNSFIQKLGAKLIIGMCTPDSLNLDRYVLYNLYHHEVLRYIEVVGLIGARPVTMTPTLEVTEKDIKKSQKVISRVRKPFVVIHPGAHDSRRQWYPYYFAKVADGLVKHGYEIIVTGIEDEKFVVDSVLKEMKSKGTNACGKLSLSGLIGLFSQADLLIANDTGPLHVARAVGTKTVGIYWGPHAITWGLTNSNKHAILLSWLVNCPKCGLSYAAGYPLQPTTPDCGHIDSFVYLVKPDEVISSAMELLRVT